MNMYEAVIILDARMSEKETKEKIKKYNDMIQAWCSTKKVKINDMGIKNLAYAIKEIHTKGYYVIFTFMSERENVIELESHFRIDDHVIKFIVVRREEDEDIELEDYIPENSKSEQKIDALDVLLGLADYNKSKHTTDIRLTNDEKYDIIRLRKGV